MATKPWKKNAWSFRADVMCNASTMAFSPGLYPPPPAPAPPPVSPPRRRGPLIFQRLEDAKEEHALRSHVDACQKYLQSKDKVKRQCGKSDKELLMENSHLFRTRLENAEFLELARGVEDCHSGEQVWAMSLREHWTVEPRIGDLYSTPICYQKEGSQKEIEQIGSPLKENLHHLISDSSTPRNTKQLSTVMLYKRFIKKCEKKLAKVKLHMPDFLALEVVGTRLSADLETKADEAIEPCSLESAMKSEVLDHDWEDAKQGPRAELSPTNLFLHGKPGEHVRSLVTLINTGSTSLYYQWHQQPPMSLLVEENQTFKCMVQAGDDCPKRASFFYVVPMAGCLLPGQRKDFYIEFHPRFPGTFMETWNIHFSPKLSAPLQALHLHGAAALPEDEDSELQRKLFQQNLDVRQRTRGLDEVLCEILEKAIMRVPIAFKKAPGFVASSESFNFLRRNADCFEEIPLYYNPAVFLQFEYLATEILTKGQANIEDNSSVGEAASRSMAGTMHTWDCCVSKLVCSLDDIHSDEKWKEMIRNKVACLQLLAAIPPHPTTLLYTAMYKALIKIAGDVEEVMEESQNKSEISSDFDMEGDSNLEFDFVKSMESSSSHQASSANVNVGQSSGKSDLSKQAFTYASVVQVEAVKAIGSGPSRQGIGDANVGQSKALQTTGVSPFKQAVANENVQQADSLKISSSMQVTASIKAAGTADNPNNGIVEQEAGAGKMEGNVTTKERVRSLLQEGVVEQFLNNVEDAFAKLGPIVQKQIKCCMAEGDKVSASWLALWYIRISHALAH